MRQLFEILGVGILIDGEVGLHRPQLVMFERRPHPLGALLLGAAASAAPAAASAASAVARAVVHHPFHRRQITTAQHVCIIQSL